MDEHQSSGSTTIEPGGQWVRDMRRTWQKQRSIRAEAFIGRVNVPNPEEHDSIAIDLVYEEYCLRTSGPGGEDPQLVEAELKNRFSQWSEALAVMFDCHDRLLLSPAHGTRWPAVGETVGNFRLTAELGKGAHGKVFLAVQNDLADRPVVVKLIPVDGYEHLSLARLQHTHIVPVYSVTDDFERDLRILCMPYFGRSTFATIFKRLADVPIAERTAHSLIAVLDEESQDKLQTAGLRAVFERLSYAQVICSIMAALADALHFAHARALVHFDLKPSNLLLTRDCQPMLLDFHLARPPVPAGTLPERFGGSAPYMAPEQATCFGSIERGEAAPLPLDGRADIFALGQVLIEALAGFNPSPERGALPEIERLHGTGLRDLCAKCIADTPGQRYASADLLAQDLRRHGADLPLLGVRNRDLAERLQKWKRRHSRYLWKWSFAGLAAVALCTAAWFIQHSIQQVNSAARAARQDGDRFLASGLPDEAIAAYTRGIESVSGSIGSKSVRQTLLDGIAAARRAELAAELKEVARSLREFYASGLAEGTEREQFLDTCQSLWDHRADILQAMQTSSGENNGEAKHDFQDLALFLATNRPTAAGPLLTAARAEFGDNAALEYVNATLHEPPPALSAMKPPRGVSTWELCAIGRDLLLRGLNAQATEHLLLATRLSPSDFWANYYEAVAMERLGRYADAIPCLSVCIGADPQFADAYLKRAIAADESGHADRAIFDDDQAVKLSPASAAAALHRGSVLVRLGRTAEAQSEFARARTLGADPQATRQLSAEK